jgi:microcystin-dependent protein
MNRRFRTMSLAVFAAVAVAGGYHLRGARASGIPGMNTLAYSGTLINNGQPENASHFILLKLWEKDGANASCSTIPAGNTAVVNGRFTLPLDASCVAVIHKSPDVEVEVVVDGVSMGKTTLAAVPYAVEADTASNFAPGSAIASLVPPGTVVPYAGVISGTVNAPPGWLLCDGAAVSRAQHPALFTAIGTGWGAGDGATTFNTPDLRGVFLRGVDPNATKDPDANSRTAIQSGGNTGAKVGTAEGGAFASHNHGVNDPGHDHDMTFARDYNVAGPTRYVSYTIGALNVATRTVASQTGISLQNTGTSSETRPVNAAVNYIIKL